jgi:hypothetical protein
MERLGNEALDGRGQQDPVGASMRSAALVQRGITADQLHAAARVAQAHASRWAARDARGNPPSDEAPSLQSLSNGLTSSS